MLLPSSCELNSEIIRMILYPAPMSIIFLPEMSPDLRIENTNFDRNIFDYNDFDQFSLLNSEGLIPFSF